MTFHFILPFLGEIVTMFPYCVGLAIKDFWQVDDRTIVFVADPTFGNDSYMQMLCVLILLPLKQIIYADGF